MTDDPLVRLRALCGSHPGVTERESHGEPTWFVGGRTFVTYADHHHDDRVAFWCAAPTVSRSRWSNRRPTGSSGRRTSVSVAGSGSGWTCRSTGTRSRPIVADAYRLVASTRRTRSTG